jgi:hypothetical protein
VFDPDLIDAERSLRRAIDLDPAEPDVRHSYSHSLLAMARFRESLSESQREGPSQP